MNKGPKKLKYLALALLLCAFAFGGLYAEEGTDIRKQAAKDIVTAIATAKTDGRRYELAHLLAKMPGDEIASALSAVKADTPPASVVAVMTVALSKGIDDDMRRMLEIVVSSSDVDAKVDMFDMMAYSADFKLYNTIIRTLLDMRDRNLEDRAEIHMWRAAWKLFTFFGSQFALENEDFKMPRLFRQPLEMILADNTASETVRADAAITLAEMGYDSEEVMEFVNAHSNDPTELGRRARGILNGHNILDEVLTRARMMHPDFGEKEVRRYAIEAAKGMTNALDRHTTFFDEEAVKSWEESRTGEYGGIGAYVSVVEGFFVISRPFYNGPAYEAGLRSGDRIIEVNGEEMMGDDLNYLVSKLKGTPGTEVNVKIFRRGWTSPREFTLTRAKIDVPNIHVTSLPGDLGYIRLDSFSQKATEQMEQALSDISASDAKGLVLDLRGNPGGGLMTAVDIVSMFVEGRKLVVYDKGRPEIRSRNNYFSDTKFDTFDKPVVLLVNGFSASASEIVSGALKHYKRATLIGEKTYGKGSVQVVFWVASTDFSCQLKLTIAKYYLPNDNCIHGVGIEPDMPVEPQEIQGWVFDEQGRLREAGILSAYVDKIMAEHREIAFELAANDYGDYTRYPDFELWADSVDTILDRDMLRYILHDELRRVVQDEKGKEFPCDPGSDVQLQKAIIELVRKTGRDPAQVEDIAPFVKIVKEREQAAVDEKRQRDKLFEDKPENAAD